MNISEKIVEFKDVLLNFPNNILLVGLDLNDLTKEALDVLVEFKKNKSNLK